MYSEFNGCILHLVNPTKTNSQKAGDTKALAAELVA